MRNRQYIKVIYLLQGCIAWGAPRTGVWERLLPERLGVVALLAGPAETAAVCVVVRMAAMAGVRHGNLALAFLAMAARARQAVMRAGKREICLLGVVEAPPAPAVRRMARRASVAKRAVMVLVLVAA